MLPELGAVMMPPPLQASSPIGGAIATGPGKVELMVGKKPDRGDMDMEVDQHRQCESIRREQRSVGGMITEYQRENQENTKRFKKKNANSSKRSCVDWNTYITFS